MRLMLVSFDGLDGAKWMKRWLFSEPTDMIWLFFHLILQRLTSVINGSVWFPSVSFFTLLLTEWIRRDEQWRMEETWIISSLWLMSVLISDNSREELMTPSSQIWAITTIFSNCLVSLRNKFCHIGKSDSFLMSFFKKEKFLVSISGFSSLSLSWR